MKLLAITHPGLESVTAEEVKRILNVDAQQVDGGVIFDTDKPAEFCYKARTILKVLHLLKEGNIKGMAMEITSLNPDIHETFLLSCDRKGTHEFNSQTICDEISEEITKKTGKKHKYREAGTSFRLIIRENKYWFGIDITGEDLGRREYRVFLHRESIKGSMAAGVLLFAGYEGGNFLDPFCHDGIFAIEAAHIEMNRSTQFFHKDKLMFNEEVIMQIDQQQKRPEAQIHAIDTHFGNISAAKKNAKIAGVLKAIKFSKVDPEWLDLKLEKNSIRCIATHLPETAMTEKRAMKLYESFFKRSAVILAKSAPIACLTTKAEMAKQAAQSQGFKLEKEQTVFQGKKEMQMMLFTH